MKTRILVKEGEYRLAKAYCMDAKIDAQELYCFLTGMDKVQLFLKAEEEVDPEIEEKYMELIAKRAERIPLQHITGVYGTYVQGVAGRADPAPGHGNSGDGSCQGDPGNAAGKAEFF